MRDDAYSPLKATRHLDIIEAVRARRPARPAHVQLVLSDLCNQACDFCSYRDPEYPSSQRFYEVRPGLGGLRRLPHHPERDYNPRRQMPTDKALEIITDCAELGVSAIQFTGGGEPTVHPEWQLVVGHAQELGLATALVTNGVKLGTAFRWLLERLKWLRVSLDAGTPETYSAIRHVPESHFLAALEGVRRAAQFGVDVGVSFVVTPHNWREVIEATRLAREHGASNIRIAAQVSADPALHDGYRERATSACEEAEGLAREGFRVYNRFTERSAPEAPDYEICGYQSLTTYIGADLGVYRCCRYSYNERGLVGSLREQRFAELWMSQSRVDEMAAFDARGCEACSFNTINRPLDYMLRPAPPAHSEFV